MLLNMLHAVFSGRLRGVGPVTTRSCSLLLRKTYSVSSSSTTLDTRAFRRQILPLGHHQQNAVGRQYFVRSFRASPGNMQPPTMTQPLPKIEHRNYENALIALDSLTANVRAQSNSALRQHRTDCTSRQTTELYYIRSGLPLALLDGNIGNNPDALSVIHVTGSKGKGSTCAQTESILRHCGVRTGFFSSPHLVDVEERFRIDGRPLARDKFATYFWHVYERLYEHRDHSTDMPFYFQFLTIMAFHVFAGERCACSILEVGIGGEHDCTNIVRGTRSAAITALGLEHTQMLGNSLADIAWQKAGIAKPGCTVFSLPTTNEVAAVLRSRCEERGAQLRWVPAWDAYVWPKTTVDGDEVDWTSVRANPMRQLNGSLAIQLSYDWIRQHPDRVGDREVVRLLTQNDNEADGWCLDVLGPVARGLKECQWPGRFQETRVGNCRLYIDGAHTMESVTQCVNWFHNQTASHAGKKCLLFNVTGNRDAPQMLHFINETVPFDLALFSPNVARRPSGTGTAALEVRQLVEFAEYWRTLRYSGTSSDAADSSTTTAMVFGSVEQVFQHLHSAYSADKSPVDVLVTGSLYMVGAVVELLDDRVR